MDLKDLSAGDYVVYCAIDGIDEDGQPRYSLFVASAPSRTWGRIAVGPCRAVLSPNKGALAYEVYKDADLIEIGLIELQSGVRSPLPGSEGCHLGSWSPDGAWLAVGCDDGEIHVLSPDDVSPGQITDCSFDAAFCLRPSWSPDGSLLAFEYSHEFHSNNGLYILEAACVSAPHSCPSVTTYEVLGFGPYGWSPDSRNVSFQRSSAEVGILDIHSNASHYLSIGPEHGDAIRSPDGDQFAYSDGAQVFIAKEDGSQPDSITSGLTDKIVVFWLVIP